MTKTETNSTPKQRNPWAWIPTLYFAEGIPYVVAMTVAGNHVQTFWHFKHRHRTIYQLVVSPLGHQTAVEPDCRSAENQTMVDYFYAIDYWCKV